MARAEPADQIFAWGLRRWFMGLLRVAISSGGDRAYSGLLLHLYGTFLIFMFQVKLNYGQFKTRIISISKYVYSLFIAVTFMSEKTDINDANEYACL
mgnify:CR=1